MKIDDIAIASIDAVLDLMDIQIVRGLPDPNKCPGRYCEKSEISYDPSGDMIKMSLWTKDQIAYKNNAGQVKKMFVWRYKGLR